VDAVRWSREVADFFLAKGVQPLPATTPEEERAELQQLLKLPLAYVRSVEGVGGFRVSAAWMQVSFGVGLCLQGWPTLARSGGIWAALASASVAPHAPERTWAPPPIGALLGVLLRALAFSQPCPHFLCPRPCAPAPPFSSPTGSVPLHYQRALYGDSGLRGRLGWHLWLAAG
jgi:hypothetical protein